MEELEGRRPRRRLLRLLRRAAVGLRLRRLRQLGLDNVGERAGAGALPRRADVLAEDREVRLVRRQRQHDEVGVEAVEAVARVRLVAGLQPLQPDELHDLVLALAGDRAVGEDHLDPLPARVRRDLLVRERAEEDGEAVHERRARRDHVGIERPALALRRHRAPLGRPLGAQPLLLLLLLLRLLRRAEAARALLVHLARGATPSIAMYSSFCAGAPRRTRAPNSRRWRGTCRPPSPAAAGPPGATPGG